MSVEDEESYWDNVTDPVRQGVRVQLLELEVKDLDKRVTRLTGAVISMAVLLVIAVLATLL